VGAIVGFAFQGSESGPHDAETASVPCGDFVVRIEKADIAGARSVRNDFAGNGFFDMRSSIAIYVVSANISQTRVARYGGFAEESPRLTDNFGNVYSHQTCNPGNTFVDQSRGESVHPGMEIKDMLVFDQPTPQITDLRLELPAQPFGGRGKLTFIIPRRMISANGRPW
jgi:hypothetical protein